MKKTLTNLARRMLPSDGNIGNSNSSGKEAWLEQTLKTIPAGSTILDAGAGELAYKKFCAHLKYTAQDFGQYDGKSYKTGNWDNSKLDIVSDITNIPVPDASYDAIMCVEVFEHIPEPILAIREFSRILKQGGVLITTAPFCSFTHQQPYYFANGFSRYWYEKVLPENGFKIEELTQNGNFFVVIAAYLRMLSSRMAGEYSTGASIYLRLLIKLMLPVLNKLSKHDRGSQEILCFGIYVVAKKQ